MTGWPVLPFAQTAVAGLIFGSGYSSVSHRHSASQVADGRGGALTFQSADAPPAG